MSSSMVVHSSAACQSLRAPFWPRVTRIVTLSLIIVMHIGLFYALQRGLTQQASQVSPDSPKEIFASFIAVEKPQEKTGQKQAMPPQPAPVPKPIVQPSPVPTPHKVVPEQAIAPSVAMPPVVASEAPVAAITAPAAMPAPTIQAQPKTLATGVEYIQAPQPEYPPIAKRMGEEGRVILRVLVNEKGRAERAEIQKSSGSNRLDEAAQKAVMAAVFKPHSENGRAVAVYAIIPITFTLNK